MAAAMASSVTCSRPVVAARQASRLRPTQALSNTTAFKFAGKSAVRQRGALLTMANEKQGKGGEEGGRKFDNSAFGKLAQSPNFTLFSSAVTKNGLESLIATADKQVTVFAPNDDAMTAAAKSIGCTKLELISLPNMPEILKNHIVDGMVASSDLGSEATTVGGGKLSIDKSNGVKVNGVATVKKADFKADNGLIHVIDAVLMP